jgi:hypothetical protein
MSDTKTDTVETINAYYDGICDGVYAYAYMKDGVYYVGTTGRTLKQALQEVNAERNFALERLDSKSS